MSDEIWRIAGNRIVFIVRAALTDVSDFRLDRVYIGQFLDNSSTRA